LAATLGGALLCTVMAAWAYIRQSAPEKAHTIYEFRGRVVRGSMQEYWLLNKATQLNPYFDEAQMAKAYSLLDVGLYGEAFEAMDKAILVRPIERLAYRANVKLYRMHDYEGALKDLRALDALTPNFRDAVWGEDLYHVIGLAKMQLHQPQVAIAYFDRCIKETIEEMGANFVHVRTYYFRAMCKWKLGMPHEALEDLEIALGLFDKYTEAYYQKAHILKSLGQDQAAYDAIKQAKKYYKQGYLYRWGVIERLYPSDMERALAELCVDETI
ncbi:MAG: hypothetical protein AAF738_04660, partial [Bacteroidota bacterium]